MCHFVEVHMACGHSRRSALVRCCTAIEAALRDQQLGQDSNDVECQVPDVIEIGLVSCCEQCFGHLLARVSDALCKVVDRALLPDIMKRYGRCETVELSRIRLTWKPILQTPKPEPRKMQIRLSTAAYGGPCYSVLFGFQYVNPEVPPWAARSDKGDDDDCLRNGRCLELR